jgi:hypothetical protein
MAIARYYYFLREKMDRDPNVLPVREARRLLTDARAAWKSGLTEVPERLKAKRRPRVVMVADEIRRYNQQQIKTRKALLLDLRAAIDAALAKMGED